MRHRLPVGTVSSNILLIPYTYLIPIPAYNGDVHVELEHGGNTCHIFTAHWSHTPQTRTAHLGTTTTNHNYCDGDVCACGRIYRKYLAFLCVTAATTQAAARSPPHILRQNLLSCARAYFVNGITIINTHAQFSSILMNDCVRVCVYVPIWRLMRTARGAFCGRMGLSRMVVVVVVGH